MANAALPEWDSLVGAGHIDSLTHEQLLACTEAWRAMPRGDDFFGLILAYAAYAAGASDQVADIVSYLRAGRGDHFSMDEALLTLPLRELASDDARKTIRQRIVAGDIPTLKWGVAIATTVFDIDDNPLGIFQPYQLAGSVLTSWVVPAKQ